MATYLAPDKKETTSADGNNPLQQTDHKAG